MINCSNQLPTCPSHIFLQKNHPKNRGGYMADMLQKLYKVSFLFVIGGSLYYTIEFLFRGRSHWTMFCVGGFIFLYAGHENDKLPSNCPLWKLVLRIWAVTLIIEFLTGWVVNLRLGWQVWDYSKMPVNLMGQICLPFALLFLPLCTAAVYLNGYMRHWLFREKKPVWRRFN